MLKYITTTCLFQENNNTASVLLTGAVLLFEILKYVLFF